jgi:hypothetical protein
MQFTRLLLTFGLLSTTFALPAIIQQTQKQAFQILVHVPTPEAMRMTIEISPGTQDLPVGGMVIIEQTVTGAWIGGHPIPHFQITKSVLEPPWPGELILTIKKVALTGYTAEWMTLDTGPHDVDVQVKHGPIIGREGLPRAN